MRGPLDISGQARSSQERAADPSCNVWVRANAGSGKTWVLSRRVLRLLINRVRPEEILCLTYTKAAASEMRTRVRNELARWAVHDDGQLSQALFELEGKRPDRQKQTFARQLFARTLETPGGLKIHTIHAFCESILHRFPLESGVPFDFRVDDAQKRQLLDAARDEVLAGGHGDEALMSATAKLFALTSDSELAKIIDAAFDNGTKIPMVIANKERANKVLGRLLGLSDGQTVDRLAHEICNSPVLPSCEYRSVFEELAHLGVAGNFRKKLEKQLALAHSPEHILATFLAKKGAMPGSRHEPWYGVASHNRELASRLETETERLFELSGLFQAAQAVDQSLALLDVVTAIHVRYQARKRQRSLLDFDDLIRHLRQLLEQSQFADWVAYKLDAGISHILVDESQDTNPEQWNIVHALVHEFFDGESAVDRSRTVFAVGDEKQSIFSFQGAEPRLFPETGRRLRSRAVAANKPWEDITLKTSFRTVGTVLRAVDLVFAQPAARVGLTGDDVSTVHEAARTTDGGRVEIWAAVEAPDQECPSGDGYPLVATALPASREDILAKKIAATISEWMASGRHIGGREAVVKPGDILILVQSRGPAFHAMIRALKQAGLPNLGEDVLSVATHIAVEDLLVLAEALLNPADDLALATVLKSPLFGWSESDLFALARGRRNGNDRVVDQRANWSLWVQLKHDAEKCARAGSAFNVLDQWRRRLDVERPYEFFARILFREGGLKNFYQRLGFEVDDVIAEFLNMALDHEQSEQPSLTAFVAGMRENDSRIKRDLSEASGAIRVMTVHGAKGLEAPIVFLLDATTPARTQRVSSVMVHVDHDKPQDAYLLWANAPSARVGVLVDAQKAREEAEYRRRLYVALTRAEDELYVTGVARRGQEKSWHQLVLDGLRDEARVVTDDDGAVLKWLFTETPDMRRAGSGSVRRSADASRQLPDWLSTSAPAPAIRDIIAPSEYYKEPASTAGRGSGDPEFARLKGRAIHALLQLLPGFATKNRVVLAKRALKNLMPLHPQWHDKIIADMIKIANQPDFADFFGPAARAEVAVAADIELDGRPVRIAGRIDRLVVSEDRVQILDFKSDVCPPAQGAPIPRHYYHQLRCYRAAMRARFPERKVACAILWTENLTLSKICDSEFDKIAKSFTST